MNNESLKKPTQNEVAKIESTKQSSGSNQDSIALLEKRISDLYEMFAAHVKGQQVLI